MLEETNERAAILAKQWDKIGIGGSDSHALPSVGTAYTEVPGARDKDEFFAGLREGAGVVHGESGSFTKLTRDVLIIAREMMREKYWTVALSPLAMLIPAITLFNYCDERAFSRRWGARVLEQSKSRKHSRWVTVPRPVAQTAMGEFV